MKKLDAAPSLDDQAADWLLRLRDDDVSPDDIEAAFDWQNRSAAHRDAFARAETFWRLSDRLPVPSLPAIGQSARRRRALRSVGLGWTAIAASLLVAGGLVIRMMPGTAPVQPQMVEGVDAGGAMVLPPGNQADTHATATGENRTIPLEDGSEVVLGGASAISVSYTPAVRRIVLVAGEALFRVRKNPIRPFLVDSAGGETQAVGTVFDVHRGADSVTVTVVEGAVHVQPFLSEAPSESMIAARLAAGHQVSYSPKGQFGPIRLASVERTTSWRDGELTFVDKPLAEVVADLNRYSSRPISVRDESLRAVHITGMVSVGKMDEWLSALEKSLPLKIVATQSGISLEDRSGIQSIK